MGEPALSMSTIPLCVRRITLSRDEIHPGARLQELADRKGLNQTQVGQAIGVEQGSVSRLYRGTQALSIEVAVQAAEYFGVRAGWLLFGEGEPHSNTSEAFDAGRMEGLRAARAAIDAQIVAATSPGAEIQSVGRQVEAAIVKAGKKQKPQQPVAAPRRARGQG